MKKNSTMGLSTFLLVVFTACNTFLPIYGKVGFPKSMGMDHQFPPTITRPVGGIPIGHLRPLGFQRNPSGKVMNTLEMPHAHAFNIKYIKSNKPVVIREAMKHQPILKEWENDAYLENKYGKLNVTVTVKKERRAHEYQWMTMKKFLMDYTYEDWYLSTIIPPEMAKELPVPGCMRCGTYRKRLQEAELWMSSGGTASMLHSHEDHTLHCVLFGRKDFIVIEAEHRKHFNYKEKYHNAGAGYSPLDMDFINMFQNSNIAKTPWTYSTLSPGDCLFLPAGYMHQVRSYGRGMSYTVLFAPSLEFDSSDCRLPVAKKDDKPSIPSLADVDFVWTSRNGDRVLDADKMSPTMLTHILDMLIRDKDKLHKEQFEHFYLDALQKAYNYPPAKTAFEILTGNPGKKFITRTEIRNLKLEQLQRLCILYNDAFLEPTFNKEEL
ncbi:lysine-specific demethylase 8-like [Mizuhopecten yessoensis]|uniref:Lysine-specific demethylase 8 n=1 Tax=Mizuhopecten yessoensis TaxID=6573 RepID=A0A210PSQ6_MIZYE|nr:lysine-specific demethylase 8-like [Mizuhopecten yessoensis]OWF39537.1 Lysine-specific demethylase 8 [Mizuhopecten yessoensis]